MMLHEIFRVVSRFPGYISCYNAENRLPWGQCMRRVFWCVRTRPDRFKMRSFTSQKFKKLKETFHKL